MIALAEDHLDCLEFLLNNGADVNAVESSGESVLFQVIRRGGSYCKTHVCLLIKHQASVNQINLFGVSLAGFCAYNRHVDERIYSG